MNFFFRKKKTDSNLAHAARQSSEHPPPLQGQVDELQAEVRLLNKRLLSMAAKVPSLAFSTSDSSSPGAVPAMKGGYGTMEQKRPSSVILGTRSCAQVSDSRLLNDEIVLDNSAAAAIDDPVDVTWKSDASHGTILVENNSMTSTDGEGEVFYKDGKKHRRVVRMVRPESRASSPNLERSRSSFRSMSSEYETKSVTEGYVEGMRARFSPNTYPNEAPSISAPSYVSNTKDGQKSGLRVRGSPFATPTKTEQKIPIGQTTDIDRPSQIPPGTVIDNPWLRNDIKKSSRQEKLGCAPRILIPPMFVGDVPQVVSRVDRHDEIATNEQSPFATPTNVKITSEYLYTKTSSETRAPPYASNFSSPFATPQGTRSKTGTGFRQMSEAHLEKPRADTNNQKSIVTKPLDSDKPSGIISCWNPMAMKACEKTSGIISTFRPLDGCPARSKASLKQIQVMTNANHKAPLSKEIEKIASSPSSLHCGVLKQTKAKETLSGKHDPMKPSHRATEKYAIVAPTGSMHPPCLLDQIRKHDIQLKKFQPLREGATVSPNSQKGSSSPSDLLAGIRAGVTLKKIEKSTLQEPKKYVSPLSELLTKIQEKKAEYLRKELAVRDNEIDW